MRRVAAIVMAGVGVGVFAGLAGSGPRISAQAPAAEGWRAVRVAGGLERPWGIAWLPDGRALITERAGRLRILKDGVLEPEPVRGVPEVLAEGQGGLLDVSVHPRFGETRWVYLTYSTGTGRENRTVLGRGVLAGSRLIEFRELFRVSQDKRGGQHFGSRLVWLPDGTLLMSIGDGGNPPSRVAGRLSRENAPRTDSHLGKVLRLTEEGEPAEGNPLAGEEGALPEIWSRGHRNIQGMAYDAERGVVWATEHGSQGGDELNVIEAGRFYGWPEVTYSNEYGGGPVSGVPEREDVTAPRLVWTPSKAPSGLAVYRGDAFPAWRGDLFSGALAGQHIRRIDLEDGEVVGEEELRVGVRVRDVRSGPDGELYVLTDEPRGALLRIEPAR
jgi:glucose/arabinose dehydrogenase